MAFAEIFSPPHPPSQRLIDLLHSFPRQARLALGRSGVAWATAAGIVGLVCCAVSFTVVALSLHETEIEQRQRQAVAIMALDSDNRLLLRAVMAATSAGPTPATAEFPVRDAWARFEVSLASICANPEGSAANADRLRRLCDVHATTYGRIAPAIEAFDPPRRLLDMSATRDLLALRDEVNNLQRSVANDAEAMVGRLIGDYKTALLVLTLSTSGFVAAGLVLILLVGRTSIDYHAQWRETCQARDMLRETIGAVPAGIVVYDADERLQMFNSTAAAVTPSLQRPDAIGRTYEELVRDTARQLEAAGKGPQPVDEWLARFRGKNTQRTRQAIDGRWFEWSERSTPSGRTVGLRVDVTEIKSHEQALERARAEYQSLVDSLSDVVFKLDIKSGLFTFASAATADFFGIPAAQLVGMPILDFVSPEDREMLRDHARRNLNSPSTVYQVEFRMKAAGGAMRHVEIRVRKTVDEHGRDVFAGVIHDVEDRVLLMQQLEAETSRLRSIVESSGALIVLVDQDLRISMINSEFTSATGVAQVNAVGRPLQDVMKCPLDPSVLDSWRSGPVDCDRAEPARFAVKLRDPQGHKQLIAVTATPVAGADGRMTNIVLLGVDETDRRKAEQALHDVERFATVGEMAGTMAHEISQPLQVIAIACASAREELVDTIKRGDVPDSEYAKAKLDRIAQQVECASRIVGDLRAFVRGTGSDRPSLFNPADAVRSAVDLTSYGVRQAGLVLSELLADGLPPVAGDVRKLEQVLVNLINNACDAGGPTIGITVDLVQQETGPLVRIAVEDSGPGIDPGILPRLFVAFVTTKPRGKGTGLGLRICRRLVEEMSGSISATNRAEGGARFEILLPAAIPPVALDTSTAIAAT